MRSALISRRPLPIAAATIAIVLAVGGPSPVAGGRDGSQAGCVRAVCTLECDDECDRAVCAADAGLVLAAETLGREAARFIITRGEIDASYARDIWLGTYDPADGDVFILPPEGYEGDPAVTSLVGALLDSHSQTRVPVPLPCPADEALPYIDAQGTLHVQPIPLTADGWDGPYVRLTYQLRDELPHVRVTSQGVDGQATWTERMDFRLDKVIDFAIISSTRITIGSNVLVEGSLGTHYGTVPGEIDDADADPLVMRSDFIGLDQGLDVALDVLHQQLVLTDTDGDNRLLVGDPVESHGLMDHSRLRDHDGNGYVDDFDLFLAYYDADGDARVVYDTELTGGLPEEFTGIDDQLARLIDQARPDRDGDGWITPGDTALGYRDGVLDVLDDYAKVGGRLAFAVAREAWDEANGASYQTVVQGPLRPDSPENAPVSFEVSELELPEITAYMFDGIGTWLWEKSVTGFDFTSQVQAQIALGGEYELPDHYGWEPMPYGSPEILDYYQRPVFRNMTFTNVRIPKGENALFEHCTFIGVTFVETNEDCVHENWNYAGAVEPIDDGNGGVTYQLRFPDLVADSGGVPVPNTRWESNNIRFHGCTFLGTVAGDRICEYTHWRNRLQFTGSTRFFIDPDDPDLAEEADASHLRAILSAMDPADRQELAKVSIVLPRWPVDVINDEISNGPTGIWQETPRTRLERTILAGTLEARGTVDIRGSILMTFRPVAGEGPLFYGGHPSDFKTALGCPGPDECGGDLPIPGRGDRGLGEITIRTDPDSMLPDGIPWPISVQAVD